MAEYRIPLQALKGRGLAWRQPHRFERDVRDAFDDGWGSPDLAWLAGAEALPPATEVRWEDARSAITRNDSPDVGFSQSVNDRALLSRTCRFRPSSLRSAAMSRSIWLVLSPIGCSPGLT